VTVETEHEHEHEHPFFHTMVVMGSALALGCGGMSNSADPDRTASGGSGGSGKGGSGGSGGKGGTGGTGGTGGSSGGTSGTGGNGGTGSLIITAGTGNAGPVDAGPFTCEPAQWTCSDNRVPCYGDGYGLPQDCGCDESRPKTPADCPAGEIFTCRNGTHTYEGVPYTQPVLFDCQCVKEQVNCEVACELLYADSGTCIDEFERTGGKSILCGCAVIVLR
jgi:hypothetical protein